MCKRNGTNIVSQIKKKIKTYNFRSIIIIYIDR